MAGSRPPGDEASDAARWWRAYTLADSDQVDELRKLTASGDDHARRQLASWLSERAFSGQRSSDRAKLEEAIEVIRPVADAGEDVAELWLACWLDESDRLDELRQRADGGSYHAGRLLARCLARHDLLDELRQRANSGSDYAWRELGKRLADRDMGEELRELITAADADTRQLIFDAMGGSPPGMKALRVLADAGHKASQMQLGRRLSQEGRLDELRQRADNGDEYARHWLDEAMSQLYRSASIGLEGCDWYLGDQRLRRSQAWCGSQE
jgi:hypothetical protein